MRCRGCGRAGLQFFKSVQGPTIPYISLTRVFDVRGVKRSSLGGIFGVHRNTLRNPASDRLQERLREVVHIISAAATLSGDVDTALCWFRNEPIVDYAHKTAARW